MTTRPKGWLLVVMLLGYAFLYLPILSLIVYSFNASPVGGAWQGFSLRWYESMLQNEQLLTAAWTSLKIATLSASFAVILGTMAAVPLVSRKRFKGKTLFHMMTAAPLVMPEVITGLSLLLLFVAWQRAIGFAPTRGVPTVVIAHTTMCLTYVVLIVRSRLAEMDTSIEEAALDLGARPLKVFFTITLPVISPALISGWLLAFALSLDDLVIASFTTGPGASTLPMVIFASIRFNLTPEINALATIIITFVALSVALTGYLISKEKSG